MRSFLAINGPSDRKGARQHKMAEHTRKRLTLENFLRYLEQDSTCNPAVITHVQAQIGKARASQNASKLKRNYTSFGDLEDLTETQRFFSCGPTACSA